jgi:hypothetical protein
MICERCSTHMDLEYEVEEREVNFKLWNCDCGTKFLERKKLSELAAISYQPR